MPHLTKQDIKYLQLLSKSFPSVSSAAAEIIRLQAILELPKVTEHFLSDIHGEYSYYIHILKNASGAVHAKIDDSFGDSLSVEQKNALATLIYYPERELANGEHPDAWYKMTIRRLVAVCRTATYKYTRAKIRAKLPSDYEYIIEELIDSNEQDYTKRLYNESIINNILRAGIQDEFITALCNLIFRLTVAQLHIVGDLFDRGPAAQMVIDDLMSRPGVDFVWGNHDVLWMGAAMGNPACIANAIRNSIKYGNFDTLEEGYGINVRPLSVFAMEQYKEDPCPNFLPKRVSDYQNDDDPEIAAKLLKAISVIMFKLEGQLIRRHPEYNMDDRLLLHKADWKNGTLEVKGVTYQLNETNLPTVNFKDPYALSPEEEHVVNQLILTFRRSRKLQEHLRFLMDKGAMYRVCNNNLLFHGCAPMQPDGSFTAMNIEGKCYAGKALMDVCDRMVRTANYDRRLQNTDFLWYLWCGPKSPLNGKDKIATFERTFINDKAAGVETKDPYYTLWDREETAEAILKDFGVDPQRGHIINGHVPVKKSKGETPVKAGGKFINIDGGLSKAYQPVTGICGYTLVFNSHHMYLAEHQPFDPAVAIKQQTDMLSRKIMIEQFPERLRVKDTDGGRELEQRVRDLNQLLCAYRSGTVRAPESSTWPLNKN
ncbi:MAG: fructose-1,6-bisphosphatase [Oscillospiraceae bacterium]|nr:fructose-1,6-bisphosphatase [Oscillospiraceae bacterium]